MTSFITTLRLVLLFLLLLLDDSVHCLNYWFLRCHLRRQCGHPLKDCTTVWLRAVECAKWTDCAPHRFLDLRNTSVKDADWCLPPNREFEDPKGRHVFQCQTKRDPTRNASMVNEPQGLDHADGTTNFCTSKYFKIWDQWLPATNGTMQCHTNVFCGESVSKQDASTHF